MNVTAYTPGIRLAQVTRFGSPEAAERIRTADPFITSDGVTCPASPPQGTAVRNHGRFRRRRSGTTGLQNPHRTGPVYAWYTRRPSGLSPESAQSSECER